MEDTLQGGTVLQVGGDGGVSQGSGIKRVRKSWILSSEMEKTDLLVDLDYVCV